MEHEVLRFWMMKLDAGLKTPLPEFDSGSAAACSSERINPRPQSCLCLTWSGYPSNENPIINNALRIVTECLRPTPTEYLLILAGIPPAELRRREATLSPA